MTQEEKDKITDIAKQFHIGMKDMFPTIEGTGWLVVDPLSGYLNACGIANELFEIPTCEEHPQVLIMQFPDGSKFIPAGSDLKSISDAAENWMWL